MIKIESDKFSEIYKELLHEIYFNPDNFSRPRGLGVKEKSNVFLILNNPLSNLYKNESRSPSLKYLSAEILWYFSQSNELKFISQFSKFWNKISNDGQTSESAYGNLIFSEPCSLMMTEWLWALQSLQADKNSRQAIMRFNKPRHSFIGNRDFVCTLNGIFSIRNNKLDFNIIMRSQDMWFGIIYDIPFFTLLQQQMLNHLSPWYPDLQLGSYTHYIINAHIYEKDFISIENMLNCNFIEDKLPKLELDFVLNNSDSPYYIKDIYDYVCYGSLIGELTEQLIEKDELLKTIFENIKNV
jgi:thymidylate synthase